MYLLYFVLLHLYISHHIGLALQNKSILHEIRREYKTLNIEKVF